MNNLKDLAEIVTSNDWYGILLRVGLISGFTMLVANGLIETYKSKISKSHSLYHKFIYNIIIAVVYIAGLLFAIGQVPQLGRVVQTILAGSGIIALALSLSAQESLNNVISGLFITIFKPFEVGDRVTLVNSNLTGTIEDITLRHTVIKTFINSRVVVPNSTINKEIIENSNLFDSRASSFVDIYVTYDSDIDKAMEIMSNIIGNHPYYIDIRTEEERENQPLVKVYIRELGSRGVGLRANMWTQTVGDNFEACSDVRLQIKKAFDIEGIEVPYARYTILNQ